MAIPLGKPGRRSPKFDPHNNPSSIKIIWFIHPIIIDKKQYFYDISAIFYEKFVTRQKKCKNRCESKPAKKVGYDDQLNRALYKALQAAGMHLQNYGTVFATIADKDKEEALPLIKRFYDLGFNIEATAGTAKFLKENGIRTRVKKKISDDSDEILTSIRQGYVNYVINTRDYSAQAGGLSDGHQIRQCAVENGVTVFTALDTVRVLLDVLEEITMEVSTIM